MISYRTSIITPNGKVFEGQAESLIASGVSGSFGVLGRHAPLVASLQNGPLIVKQGAQVHYFAVGSGVLEVNAQSDCLLLTDTAVKVNSLEEAKAAVLNFH